MKIFIVKIYIIFIIMVIFRAEEYLDLKGIEKGFKKYLLCLILKYI